MSDDIDPLTALKAKLNAFGKEIQPLLATAGMAKVTLVVMATRISVSTEGIPQPKPVEKTVTTPATLPDTISIPS